jgi:hypothetical protein
VLLNASPLWAMAEVVPASASPASRARAMGFLRSWMFMIDLLS